MQWNLSLMLRTRGNEITRTCRQHRHYATRVQHGFREPNERLDTHFDALTGGEIELLSTNTRHLPWGHMGFWVMSFDFFCQYETPVKQRHV